MRPPILIKHTPRSVSYDNEECKTVLPSPRHSSIPTATADVKKKEETKEIEEGELDCEHGTTKKGPN